MAQLAAFHNRSPDTLGEDEVRGYLVQMATVRKVSRSTQKIALCAIKFFFERTLGRAWTVFDVARPRKERKLPVVLSRDEVWRALAAVRVPAYRVCLTTIYSCGLRLREGTQLQFAHIDGARKVVTVPGKGGKERQIPLPSPARSTAKDDEDGAVAQSLTTPDAARRCPACTTGRLVLVGTLARQRAPP